MPSERNIGPALGLIVVGAFAAAAVSAVIATLVSSPDDQATKSTAGRSASRTASVVEARTIGVQIRRPRGWTGERAGDFVTLRSPDRAILLSVSLPPGARRSPAVLKTALSAIRREYRRVRVVGIPKGRRMANLPTRSVVTSATNEKGVKLTILTAAPQGRKRAWLVQVFAAEGVDSARLRPAQRALGTLRLAG